MSLNTQPTNLQSNRRMANVAADVEGMMGRLPIDVPRDVMASFERKLIKKGSKPDRR